MDNKQKFSRKPKRAGGIDSVTSTFKQLVNSGRVKTNIKNLLKANKSGGFDCPGCAWGDSNEGHIHFCENGAKAIAWESTDRQVNVDFFDKYTVTKLKQQSHHWLEYQGRLTSPMRYNASTDKYCKVSWQESFSLIAKHLQTLESPNQVEFYTSGRASNEASYLYQLFGRMFGTNNFPDCSNMCHEASGVALNQSIGVGKGTVVLEDFYQADAIFVYGQNPGSNHPRMMNALRKAAKGHCKIVSINNLQEVALEKFASPQQPLELLAGQSTTISHKYYKPKLGGDFAFIRGIAKTIVADFTTSINQNFIDEHTQGFTNYIARLEATSWEEIEQQSGVSKEDIFDAAKVMANSKRVISTWAMGITQHKHSVGTIQELTNLHLMLGQVGKKGAGISPVRGHSNVQGNRTMGINEQPSDDFLNRLETYFEHAMPREAGHNVQAALKALHEKTSKVLICLGGNLAAAAPDTHFTENAMCQSLLNVQISTKLNRSHLMIGEDALILPCLGRTEIDQQATGEQAITVEDTFSMVHSSRGTSQAPSIECLSETDIVARIAQATFDLTSTKGVRPAVDANTNKDKKPDWLALRDDYSKIRELIANTIVGFEDFNQRLEKPFGFHLSNAAANLQWNTPSQKAIFSNTVLPTSLYSPGIDKMLNEISSSNKRTIFTLQTLRSHDQYNTTIYGHDDRYRGIKNNRHVIFMNPKDAQKMGFVDGQSVNIESLWEDNISRKLSGFCIVFYDIPRENLAAYYPETNPLVPIDSVGDDSFTPTSKSIPVIVSAI
jgi:molybdopterin-dependent oxidoreductase alpha subunit